MLDEGGKVNFMNIKTFEMEISKSHFKKVNSKKLHEEEQAKDSREDSSYIRSHV
jgi:hypothetical protein